MPAARSTHTHLVHIVLPSRSVRPSPAAEAVDTAVMYLKRQSPTDEGTTGNPEGAQSNVVRDPWFLSTAYNMKWAIGGGAVLLLFLVFVGGYVHAKRRMRQALLAYHKWFVPKARRPNYRSERVSYWRSQLAQQRYLEPPPLYDDESMPPDYAPPVKSAEKRFDPLALHPPRDSVLTPQVSEIEPPEPALYRW